MDFISPNFAPALPEIFLLGMICVVIVADLFVDDRNRIITYCGGGIAAAVNAAAHLITGHENVAVYDGSMFEWLGEGLPTVGNGRWEIWMQTQPGD